MFIPCNFKYFYHIYFKFLVYFSNIYSKGIGSSWMSSYVGTEELLFNHEDTSYYAPFDELKKRISLHLESHIPLYCHELLWFVANLKGKSRQIQDSTLNFKRKMY